MDPDQLFLRLPLFNRELWSCLWNSGRYQTIIHPLICEQGWWDGDTPKSYLNITWRVLFWHSSKDEPPKSTSKMKSQIYCRCLASQPRTFNQLISHGWWLHRWSASLSSHWIIEKWQGLHVEVHWSLLQFILIDIPCIIYDIHVLSRSSCERIPPNLNSSLQIQQTPTS